MPLMFSASKIGRLFDGCSWLHLGHLYPIAITQTLAFLLSQMLLPLDAYLHITNELCCELTQHYHVVKNTNEKVGNTNLWMQRFVFF